MDYQNSMKNEREDSWLVSEIKHSNFPRQKRSCLKSPSRVDNHGVGGARRDEDARTGGGAVNFHSKDVEKSERYLGKVKKTFRNRREKIDAFNQVLRDLEAARAGAFVRLKELFKGHKSLVHGLKIFLLEVYGVAFGKDDDPPNEVAMLMHMCGLYDNGLYDDALNLIKKIKQRFHNQEHVYKRFLDTVIMRHKQPRDMKEIFREFSALFVDDPNLVEECMKFVWDGSAPFQQEPSGFNQVKHHSSGLPIPQKVSAQKFQRCRNQVVFARGDHYATSTAHPDYEDNKRVTTKKYLRRHVENENSKTSSHYQGEREMEPGKTIDLNWPPFPYDEKESQVVGHVTQIFTLEDENKEHGREVEIGKKTEDCRDKYSGKTIYELDLSECEQCTPSYRLLPEDYRTLLASQRSNPGVLVLNDHCVSVNPGSEGHSLKHISKYEKDLFSCEDNRFELDMLLENAKSTVTCGEALLNRIIEDNIRVEGLIRLEDYFTTMNLRCIERLYEDDGLQAIDWLRQNPALALPVILTRLNQRQEEWLVCREEFNRKWDEIYAKNDCMAHDHRTVHFKDQDVEKLRANSLVADIKKLQKKRQKDAVHQAIDADHQQPIGPHLEFKYADAAIHRDLQKLLHIKCEELCSNEQHNRNMRLWCNFFEKFLGVSCSSNRDDACKAQHGDGSLPVESLKKEERLSNVTWKNSDKNAEIRRRDSSIPAPTCLEHASLPIMPTMEEKKRDSRVFFGNDDFYVLFRLHQTLYERILLAKRKSAVADKKPRTWKDSGTLDSYARFISILRDHLKGLADKTKFEVECREIVGNSSYMLFTLDILIGKLVKRLEVVETSDKDNKLLEVYGYKKSFNRWYEIDTVYHKMARDVLHEGNIYRFECSSSPTRLSIELMDKPTENPVLNG